MKHFLRNIRGSKLWRRTLAFVMCLAVLVTMLPSGLQIAKSEDTTTTLFSGTTISTQQHELYANDIDLITNPNAEVPGDATISMKLSYIIADGNQIEVGKEYYYELPDAMKVNFGLNETLDLIDSNANLSIGTVHIDQANGRLVYQFNDNVTGHYGIPFEVSFSGGLDSSYQSAGNQVTISFPTESTPITATLTTTESTDTPTNPSAVNIYKSGSVKNIDGNNYVEWVIELETNGANAVSGTLTDVLPTGWEYVQGSAKLDTTGNYISGTITDSSSGNNIHIEVSDCKSYYHSVVRFYTTYPKTIFDRETITSNSSVSQSNTAIFTPSDSNIPGSDATGTVNITPNMLEKSGALSQDATYVTWTVVLNKEQLELKGATFEDIVGRGLSVPENVSDVTITPALGTNASLTFNNTTNSFKIAFDNSESDTKTYTITYQTPIESAGYSLPNLKNQANLTGGNYNVTKDASIPGVSLLNKEFVYNSYDDVTKTMRWKITVNESGLNLGDITLTENYGTNMEYVSIEGLEDGEMISSNGTSITLKSVTAKRELYITTKVTDGVTGGTNFYNTVTMNDPSISKNANTWIDVKNPDLFSKYGWIADKDGTIHWVIDVKSTTHTIEEMKFSDVLPKELEYVDGSFCIRYGDYDPRYYPLDTEIVKGTIESGTDTQQTISYTFDKDTDVSRFLDGRAFQIYYKTKVKATDLMATTESLSYENEATLDVTYENNLHADETEGATVNGTVGGVIDKTHNYNSGNNYVDWTVTINKGRYDLSNIVNPKISDQLSEDYVYQSGTLYAVDENGTETEVPVSDYKITVVNNRLTVILPNDENNHYLGTNSYVFRFRVLFNHASGYYSGKQITNAIDFSGDGEAYETVSNVLQHINFNQAAASASISYSIRVKKVSSVDSSLGLEGAVFQLYLDDVCVQEATTDANGYAEFTGINPTLNYTYVLKEIQAPDGYVLPATDTTVSTSADQFDETTKRKEVTIENTPISGPTGGIHIYKVDNATTPAPLSNTTFKLYDTIADAVADTNVIATKTTGTDGTISFAGLTIGATYYVKETSAADGFLLGSSIIQAQVTSADATTYSYVDNAGTATGITPDTQTINSTVHLKVTNEKAVGTLEIYKIKSGGTYTNSGDWLSGAKIGLYTDANCNYPVEAAKTTDYSGKVTYTNLELGKTYYYKELTAPDGYVLDTTVHAVTVGEATAHENITQVVTIENQPEIGSIKITKVDDSIPGKPLQNVTFTLQKFDVGSSRYVDYIPDGMFTVYTVTTDNKGVAEFTNLPFGDYQITETSTNEKYYASTPVEVTVDSLTVKQVQIVNVTKKFDLSVTKQDSVTQAVLPGAEFQLYTKNGVYVATATTDATGIVTFRDLAYGEYVLKETKLPNGYSYMTAGNNEVTSWDITTDMIDTAITAADIDSDGIPDDTVKVTQTIDNKKQNGSIQIQKNYKYTDENGNEQTVGLGGIEFTLYDEQRIKIATAISSTEAATLGQVSFNNLPYGTYYLKETKAEVTGPGGELISYIMDPTEYKFLVESDDTVKKTVGASEDLVVTNTRFLNPIISVKVKKAIADQDTNLLNNEPLSLAQFGLYRVNNGVSELITTSYSDSNGMVYFRLIDLSNTSVDTAATTYYIKELSAPAGYEMSNQQITFTYEELVLSGLYNDNADDPKADNEIKFAKNSESTATFVNQQILGKIVITKTDVVSIGRVQGVEFVLTDTNGTVLRDKNGNEYRAITNVNGEAIFTDLPFGTYVIHETGVPNGYTINTKTETIVINSDASHAVTYSNTRIDISLSKQSDTGITLTGAEFQLERQTLGGNYENVGTIVCNSAKVRIPYDMLQVGQSYRLTEVKAPAGYGYMSPILFKVNNDGSVTMTGGNGRLNGNTIIAQDQPITLTVHKKDNDTTPAYVPSAVIGIYDSQNRKLTEWTTGNTGYTIPVGVLSAPEEADGLNIYTLKEITTPEGYVTASPVSIAVKHDGSVWLYESGGVTGNAITSVDMIDKIVVNSDLFIQKLDAANDSGLAGAKFKITNASGTQTDQMGNDVSSLWSWTSNGTAHQLDASNFASTETYTLTEVSAPSGYTVAEPVQFKVIQDGVNYKFEMVLGTGSSLTYDAKTLLVRDNRIQVKVEKVDGLNAALPGAELMIYEYNATSANGLGTPILTDPILSTNTGAIEIPNTLLSTDTTYVLHEKRPPVGYRIAADILFKIDSAGTIVIQKLDSNGNLTGAGVTVYNNTIVMVDQEADLTISKVEADNHSQVVTGATLQLESEDDANFTTRTWTCTEENQVWNLDFTELRKGKHYTLTEISAPNGYAYAEPITFTVDPNTNQVLIGNRPVENRTIFMEDRSLELSVRKLDATTNAELKNAKLAIYDANDLNHALLTWTTQTAPYQVDVSKLSAGTGLVGDSNPGALHEYVLRENEAPESHNSAEDIHFAIDRDGAIYLVTEVLGRKKYTLTDNNQITMYDMPKFSVSKQDIAGEEVPGATLTITTTEDDSFQTITFVSGTTPKYFAEGTFKPGITYTLTETNAPNGYAYAESITFKFDASGTLYVNGKKKADRQAVMVDDAIAVTISKRDITNSKELAGAKLIIKNETGEVIYSFISANTPTLIPADIFTAPKLGDLQYYSLTELTAPEGYEVAETIFFAIDSEGKIYVKNSEGNYEKLTEDAIVMFDQPSATSDTTVAKGPKTGDAMQLQFVIFLGLISLFCGCVLLERSISKKN